MTCGCALDQFLQALKGALCMPEFPMIGGGYAFASNVNTATSLPANCTTASSANVKGAWAELIASTPFDAGDMVLEIGIGPGSGSNFYTVDIGIGGSGSEVVLIADLACQARSFGASDQAGPYRFRVPVPAGSRISARAADDAAPALPVYVKVTFITPTALNSAFSGVVATYGAISGSRGVNVDPGGTANTLSSWVELTPATVRAHQSITIGCSAGDNSLDGGLSWLMDIGIGGAGSEVVLIPNLSFGAGVINDMPSVLVRAYDLNIPSGVRLSVRAQASIILDGDRDIYVNLYGN